jgi:excisionase family DNA binding protein
MPEPATLALTYDAKAAARVLGVSRWTLYRAIKSGEVPTLSICSRKVLIPRWWVDAQVSAPTT